MDPLIRIGKVETASNRSFGLSLAAAFAIVALLPLAAHRMPRIWAGGIAVAFALIALFFPRALTPINRLWFRLGELLQRIVNPILMTVLYVCAVAPIGLIRWVSGGDPLNLEFRPEAATYWVTRTPPGPEAGSMAKQF